MNGLWMRCSWTKCARSRPLASSDEDAAIIYLSYRHSQVTTVYGCTSEVQRSQEVVQRPDGTGLDILGVYNDRIGKYDGHRLFTERYFHAHYISTSPMPGNVLVDYANLPKF